MTPTRLDRLIGYFLPRAGARRLAARARIAGLTRATALYDGAARTSRTIGKRIAGTSADREIWQSLRRLRDVHRDLVRNNSYAKRAVEGIAANTVGTGILPSVKSDSARAKKRIEQLLEAHLDTTAIDLDGRQNFYGLQNLVMRTVVESGEALVVRYNPPASLRLAVPLQIRVLEPDYLDLNRGTTWGLSAYAGVKLAAGHRVVQGVEYDKDGRRCAYWLFDEHPGDGLLVTTLLSRRVLAADVLHIYRQDRPGQTRGVPWGAPVIMPLWDLGDYEDAEMMRQKIAACFAVFYTDPDQRITLAASVDDQGNPVKSQQNSPVSMLEPGMIQKLPSGATVSLATPPSVQGFEVFVREQKRKIATGYGVPYEMLTGDLSQVNFSSGRMGWLEFQRGIYQWQWHMLIPHLCHGVALWFQEAAEIVSGIAPSGYQIGWTEPRREMIDPTKEIPAAVKAIRGGLVSRSEEIRRSGGDPEKIDAEIAADQARADKLKLVFDSDGRVPQQGPRGDSNPQDDKAGKEVIQPKNPSKDGGNGGASPQDPQK